jgi:hypothetical protein
MQWTDRTQVAEVIRGYRQAVLEVEPDAPGGPDFDVCVAAVGPMTIGAWAAMLKVCARVRACACEVTA